MKNRTLILLILTAMILMPLTAMAGTFDGSQPVICAVIETFECDEGIACQRGLAESIKGRNPMIDGFGLIAFASLTPIIFVMAYGMII